MGLELAWKPTVGGINRFNMETYVVMDECSCKAKASLAASLERRMLPLTRQAVALEAEHVTRGLRVNNKSTGAFVVMIPEAR